MGSLCTTFELQKWVPSALLSSYKNGFLCTTFELQKCVPSALLSSYKNVFPLQYFRATKMGSLCTTFELQNGFLLHYFRATKWVPSAPLSSYKNGFPLHYFRATKNVVLITPHRYLGLHVKFPIFLIEFNHIWAFWDDLLKSPQYHILGNIQIVCPVRTAVVDGERRTDDGRQQALFAAYKNENEKWHEKRRYGYIK